MFTNQVIKTKILVKEFKKKINFKSNYQNISIRKTYFHINFKKKLIISKVDPNQDPNLKMAKPQEFPYPNIMIKPSIIYQIIMIRFMIILLKVYQNKNKEIVIYRFTNFTRKILI